MREPMINYKQNIYLPVLWPVTPLVHFDKPRPLLADKRRQYCIIMRFITSKDPFSPDNHRRKSLNTKECVRMLKFSTYKPATHCWILESHMACNGR